MYIPQPLLSSVLGHLVQQVKDSFSIIMPIRCVCVFGKLSRVIPCTKNFPSASAPQDILASISRIFVGFSILFTYPLCFVAMRDGILELKGISQPTERQRIG